jgi:hypothetical protein
VALKIVGGILLNMIDTIPYFMSNYQPSISFLRNYFNEYPEIFKEYFAYHCKDTEERHNQSIAKYPLFFSSIKQVHKSIHSIIEEIAEEYSRKYQVSFPIDVSLIVGGFGSNAYTYRQIIPNITFALEKLSPEPDHLRVITAHEFGHAAQNIATNEAGIDWTKLQWESPLTWINQEGAAIHFSRKIAVNLAPSIYFSFNDEGHEWLAFSEKHKHEIKMMFAKDFAAENPRQVYQEWFSINGGKRFGYSRLGYFIADMFFQYQIMNLGERNAIIAWKDSDFQEQAKKWLYEE